MTLALQIVVVDYARCELHVFQYAELSLLTSHDGSMLRRPNFNFSDRSVLMQVNTKTRLKRSIINALHLANIPAILPKRLTGMGVILLLHRVRPDPGHDFAVHRSLEITPEFLNRLLERLRALNMDIIDLDEVAHRLETGKSGRRFACITLDDGYRDNYDYAKPIFERHRVPYSIYLTTGLPDHHAIFWWLLLEHVIRGRDQVSVWIDGERQCHRTDTLESKYRTYAYLHSKFRRLTAAACRQASERLCEDAGIDIPSFCAEEGMNWDMIREIAGSDFGRIEAHTTEHVAVSRQTPDEMIEDIERGLDRTFAETGVKPRHFAYPFGDRSAAGPRDFAILASLPILTATRTVEDVLHARHADHLHALPRIEVNGHYQSDAFLDIVLRGLAPLLKRTS